MNRYARYALAGLQTGITGAIAILIWFAIASKLTHRTSSWVPNLVAAAFYGDASVNTKAAGYTIVGIAMIVFAYGAMGMLFGLVVKERRASLRLLCYSVVAALAIHYLMLRVFWKGANPVAHLYAPDTQILIAHIVFGFVLVRYPRVLGYVSRVT
jgi:hypothetical protein